MLLLSNIDEFNNEYVHFGERTTNNVIQNSDFCRINYSCHNYSLNGVYLYFTIDSLKLEKNFNKTRINFEVEKNLFVKKLQKIEELILKKIDSDLTHVKCINHQMEQGTFKVQEYYGGNSFLLKISGVWINKYECGITYKFVSLNPFKTELNLRLCD